MIENGVYIVKEEYFDKFSEIGSIFKYNKSGNRPTFCCIEDKFSKDLFWAIPTSKITKDKNIDRIKRFINSSSSNIKSSFYHIGMTNVPCIFCISSCFPIIDKYIEREYLVKDKPLVINNKEQNNIIRKKFRRIIQLENSTPNRFEQRITDIKNILLNELNQNNK